MTAALAVPRRRYLTHDALRCIAGSRNHQDVAADGAEPHGQYPGLFPGSRRYNGRLARMDVNMTCLPDPYANFTTSRDLDSLTGHVARSLTASSPLRLLIGAVAWDVAMA